MDAGFGHIIVIFMANILVFLNTGCAMGVVACTDMIPRAFSYTEKGVLSHLSIKETRGITGYLSVWLGNGSLWEVP